MKKTSRKPFPADLKIQIETILSEPTLNLQKHEISEELFVQYLKQQKNLTSSIAVSLIRLTRNTGIPLTIFLTLGTKAQEELIKNTSNDETTPILPHEKTYPNNQLWIIQALTGKTSIAQNYHDVLYRHFNLLTHVNNPGQTIRTLLMFPPKSINAIINTYPSSLHGLDDRIQALTVQQIDFSRVKCEKLFNPKTHHSRQAPNNTITLSPQSLRRTPVAKSQNQRQHSTQDDTITTQELIKALNSSRPISATKTLGITHSKTHDKKRALILLKQALKRVPNEDKKKTKWNPHKLSAMLANPEPLQEFYFKGEAKQTIAFLHEKDIEHIKICLSHPGVTKHIDAFVNIAKATHFRLNEFACIPRTTQKKLIQTWKTFDKEGKSRIIPFCYNNISDFQNKMILWWEKKTYATASSIKNAAASASATTSTPSPRCSTETVHSPKGENNHTTSPSNHSLRWVLAATGSAVAGTTLGLTGILFPLLSPLMSIGSIASILCLALGPTLLAAGAIATAICAVKAHQSASKDNDSNFVQITDSMWQTPFMDDGTLPSNLIQSGTSTITYDPNL